MNEKIQGIVLGVIRHSDRHNIASVYTRSRGRMSFLTSAGGTPAARRRNAMLQPLALIEADVRIRAGVDLQTLGQFSCPGVWSDIYFNPAKRSTAIFLSEFLMKLLADSSPDPDTWDYIRSSLERLDGMDGYAPNFHIAFLTGLLRHAGIWPALETWRPGRRLDLQAGIFTDFPSVRDIALDPDESKMAMTLSRITFANMHRFRFTGTGRRHTLSLILRYFGIHFPGTDRLKSLEILQEVFE